VRVFLKIMIACLFTLAVLHGSELDAQPSAQFQETRRSGFQDMSEPLQAMQRDDSLNPGMSMVKAGLEHWSSGEKSCQSCHGGVNESMKFAAQRFPRFDMETNAPISLASQINRCRVQKQAQPKLERENNVLLALETLIAFQARGQNVEYDQDPRLHAYWQQGQDLFNQRMGLSTLSCAHCHDQRAGLSLGASIIPQGHANGYPSYSVQWNRVGSITRRLRSCLERQKAPLYEANAVEWTALELYLLQRSTGMLIETPSVRP
jgi:L-cysteine S-thiosulfotransferase